MRPLLGALLVVVRVSLCGIGVVDLAGWRPKGTREGDLLLEQSWYESYRALLR
jgi:hypothetical protein